MARVDDLLAQALNALPGKPPDEGTSQSLKKRYSEKVSEVVAQAFAEELRQRGMPGARPAPPGTVGLSGAERRMAGGIGAKKVDVTFATEEAGLVAALSIKSINWKDARTGNYQKNLTNRRGELLFESVTLHRRFPYAVLAAFMFLDKEAAHDGTMRRRSTFDNAHDRLRLFTRRPDVLGRDEQYERLYLLLLDANPFASKVTAYEVGDKTPVELEAVFDDLVQLIAERNFDTFETIDGKLRRL